jgi:hypothetical protein
LTSDKTYKVQNKIDVKHSGPHGLVRFSIALSLFVVLPITYVRYAFSRSLLPPKPAPQVKVRIFPVMLVQAGRRMLSLLV